MRYLPYNDFQGYYTTKNCHQKTYVNPSFAQRKMGLIYV